LGLRLHQLPPIVVVRLPERQAALDSVINVNHFLGCELKLVDEPFDVDDSFERDVVSGELCIIRITKVQSFLVV